ncbi:hypothetical protein FFLO_00941 [Filobasidium floriforme]|uniref:Small RNA 2'-O-methyltransferase n=1 Tax=Filobasidium floriforme TaxID=5210 RepID=A0A8K0JQJ8_9TREE|nr:hypothetical protein FFLO_00941 [Filobasidium floriforme]
MTSIGGKSSSSPADPGSNDLDTANNPGTIAGLHDDPAYDPTLTSPSAIHLSTSLTHTREVSMIEKGPSHVGVVFTPSLAEQRISWALDVLRKEEARSVLDVGCGEGALLKILCRPASCVMEDPIEPVMGQDGSMTANMGGSSAVATAASGSTLTSSSSRPPAGGLDVDATTIPIAVRNTAPPPSSSGPQAHAASTSPSSLDDDANHNSDASNVPPRWQRLEVEIWQGGLEKHNQRLEGFEAITGLEIIEHLNGPSLAVFPQMIFGTFRPKVVLITTPNFEFNSKFPRSHTPDGCHGPSKGFLDPTGRTERVFRHSDHKLEMTEQEFRDWCESAEEWGYTVETGGIGLSNQPSYHDDDPSRPIYATHTAIFRHTGGAPHRSPRSVRSVRLPFMPASGEEYHAHRLAVRHVHEPRGAGEVYKKTWDPSPESDETIRGIVRDLLRRWREGEVTLEEVWATDSVSSACVGSKRTLVRALGGLGNCPGSTGVIGDQPEWELIWSRVSPGGIRVRWRDFVDEEKEEKRRREDWGVDSSSSAAKEVVMTDTSGW